MCVYLRVTFKICLCMTTFAIIKLTIVTDVSKVFTQHCVSFAILLSENQVHFQCTIILCS